MDMRMSFIGMQGEGVPVPTPEFLPREVRTAPSTLSGGVPGGIENMSLWTSLGGFLPLVAARVA